MMDRGERDILRPLGTVLVALGVCVWGLYGVLRFVMGWDVTGRQFLPYHLAGVIPGVILRRHRWLREMIRRLLG